MICDDRFVNHLKTLGYNAVRLPRPNIEPRLLVEKRFRKLHSYGDLGDVLTPRAGSGAEPPPITRSLQMPSLSGMHTDTISVGIGVSLLGGMISALGGAILPIKTAYSSAVEMVFTFSDVVRDEISLAQLDSYLSNSDVSPMSTNGAKMLEADKLAIVVAVLKSRKLKVEAKTDTGQKLEIDVPVLQGMIQGNIAISSDTNVATAVTYEGATPLTFGLQARRLIYKDGEFQRFKHIGGNAFLEKLPDPSPTLENPDIHDPQEVILTDGLISFEE